MRPMSSSNLQTAATHSSASSNSSAANLSPINMGLKINAIENKQLSVKAYFINKYEQLKNPQMMNEDQINSLLTDNCMDPTGIAAVQSSTNGSLNVMELMPSVGNNKRHFSGSNSSLQNSDDEDDEYEDTDNLVKSREEKRRLSHTVAEQKRRNAIKHGYDELQSLVPSCEFMDPSSSQKVCKATILKRSIDYINELEMDRNTHEHHIESLKKEILALKILKTNYEEILKHHRNLPKDNSVCINDETKFELFTKISDQLFQSFQAMTNFNSFSELSASMLNWLEQFCTAQNLKHLIKYYVACALNSSKFR